MAARTDYEAVQSRLETDLSSGQITNFIGDASLWVDENLVGEGLSAALLTKIELYLSCHLVTLRDPRVTQAKIGDTAETYARDKKITEYLKAAVALDPTGNVSDSWIVSEDDFKVRFRVGQGFDPTLGGN